MGKVYLIHLHSPLAHAQHYIGYCGEDVEARLKRHRCNPEGWQHNGIF